MKSERRHELQHNALLEWLTQTGESVKPYLNVILLVLVAVLLGLVGYKWMSAQSAGKEAKAWDAVFAATSKDDTAQLDQTIEDYPKTTAAQWAAIIAGDMHLAAGCDDLFTTKATAADQLQKALDKYTFALETARKSEIRERATYGLARTYEAMAGTRRSQEDLERAKGEYQKVVEKWPQGAFAKAAQARLDALSQASTLEFYDALAAWEPRPAITSPQGLDGLNIPFNNPDDGLNVGGAPKQFFDDISEKIDEAVEKPGEGTPTEGAEKAAPEPDSPEAPAMPAATGDQPADGGTKPVE